MNSENHPLVQLTDYSLGLLTREERKRVDRHLRRCVRCRELVQQEHALEAEIRQTLIAATLPSPTRLRQLAPSPRRYMQRRLVTLLRPALALAIVLLLFVAGLSANGENAAPVSPYHTATTLAATATMTPTSTVALVSDAVAAPPVDNAPASQVAVSGTPVSALFAIVHN